MGACVCGRVVMVKVCMDVGLVTYGGAGESVCQTESMCASTFVMASL